MKFITTVLLLCSIQLAYSQTSFLEADAKQIINTFFEGFHKGDTILMKSTMIEKLPTQTVFTDKEGNSRIIDGDAAQFLIAIAARPEDQKWEEKLLDYKVQIDGNLAHVWTPYEFWLNGNFSHCGANAFTLAKTNEGWKIVHLIDSRRRESCSPN